jgi:DDE domain
MAPPRCGRPSCRHLRRRCCTCCDQADWRDENPPPASGYCPALGLRRLPLPARGDRAGGALVSAFRAVAPRRRGAARRARHRVDHTTVYRWVLRFAPLLAEAARPCRHAVGSRWQVDETYVKVAGQWRYVYRAVDQFGQVIDVFVAARRDATAARRVLSGPSAPPRSGPLRS